MLSQWLTPGVKVSKSYYYYSYHFPDVRTTDAYEQGVIPCWGCPLTNGPHPSWVLRVFSGIMWSVWSSAELVGDLKVQASHQTDEETKSPWEDSHILKVTQVLNVRTKDFPGGSDGKASACNAGDEGLIPGLGRSPGEGNGTPLQISCLENPMDGGAWWATVCGVAKSWTQLSDSCFHLHGFGHQSPSFKPSSLLVKWHRRHCPMPTDLGRQVAKEDADNWELWGSCVSSKLRACRALGSEGAKSVFQTRVTQVESLPRAAGYG